MEAFEIIGVGGRQAGENHAFQLRRDDGRPLAPVRPSYDDVQLDLFVKGGRRPYFTDRSGGFTSGGQRISWSTLDRLFR